MKIFLTISLFFACLTSCKDANVPDKEQPINSIDTLQSTNSSYIIKKENKWIGVKYDKKKDDYFIESPCGGRIPKIEVIQSTLIDDKGIDQPLIYRIEKKINIGKKEQILQLSYKWSDGLLTDSIIVKKVNGHVGIYQWMRYPKYNGGLQDPLVDYYVHCSEIESVRIIEAECPEQKTIELVKRQ